MKYIGVRKPVCIKFLYQEDELSMSIWMSVPEFDMAVEVPQVVSTPWHTVPAAWEIL